MIIDDDPRLSSSGARTQNEVPAEASANACGQFLDKHQAP
jgi:hypothetical protein